LGLELEDIAPLPIAGNIHHQRRTWPALRSPSHRWRISSQVLQRALGRDVASFEHDAVVCGAARPTVPAHLYLSLDSYLTTD